MNSENAQLAEASDLADQAIIKVVDITQDRDTQLLALSELGYRVQALIERFEQADTDKRIKR